MPKVGSFSAQILVDGNPVEEFGEEKSGTSTVSCFIPSVTDQTFEISVSNDSEDEVLYATFVDGKNVLGQLCSPGRSVSIDGVSTSATTYRPLKFGTLDITDDDALKDKAQWQDLGCIELKIRRVVPGSRVNVATTDDSRLVKNSAIHERSKKAGTHRIALGAEQTRTPINSVQVTYIDTLNAPYARIKFLYRPAELLQAQEIMPRPARDKRKRDDDSPDEDDPDHPVNKALAEKEERIRALLAEAEQMRAEVDAERANVHVKREPSPIRLPSSSSSRKRKRVYIDLTDD